MMTLMSTKSLTRRYLVAVLISLLLSATSNAQPSIRDRLNSLRTAGYEALYNLDYEEARRQFRQMIELAPDDPAGAQCYAASLWLQQLNESWELKATLYSAETYASGSGNVDSKKAQEFR